MIPHIVPELNTHSKDRRVLKGQPIAHVDLVGLLRQLYAQVDDDALRGDLGGRLVPDTDNLRQTITIDLDARSIPDDQARGQVCFGCLRRSAGRHEALLGPTTRRARRVLGVWGV